MNRNAKAFVQAATEIFGENAILSRDQIQRVVDERSVPYPFWFVTRQEFRSNRGQYRLPDAPNVVRPAVTATVTEEPAVVEMAQTATVHVLRQKKLEDHADTSIPEKYQGYVPLPLAAHPRPLLLPPGSFLGQVVCVEFLCWL